MLYVGHLDNLVFSVMWTAGDTKKHLHLQAESQEDMISWLQAISLECNRTEALQVYDWFQDLFEDHVSLINTINS